MFLFEKSWRNKSNGLIVIETKPKKIIYFIVKKKNPNLVGHSKVNFHHLTSKIK
jgi:hypothetical protein